MERETDTTNVEVVCPTKEELARPVNNKLSCPVSGCDKIMKSSPAYKFHLAHSHSIIENEDDVKYLNRKSQRYTEKTAQKPRRFHCPVSGCVYQENSHKHFTTYHLLRQHYLKVHAERTFACQGCDAKYSTERDLKAHHKECGRSYKCVTCQGIFQKRQSWVNHCKRLKHPQVPDAEASFMNVGSIMTRAVLDQSGNVVVNGGVGQKCGSAGAQSEGNTVTESSSSVGSISPKNCEQSTLPNQVSASTSTAVHPGTMNLTVKTSCSENNKHVNILPKQSYLIIPCNVTNGSGNVISVHQGPRQQSMYVKIAPKVVSNSTTVPSTRPQVTESLQTEPVQSCSPRKEKSVKKKLTVTTQTTTQKRKRAVAETQTSGDLILCRAMMSANLPMESRGSQVSPRAKTKPRRASVKTTETQTHGSVRTIPKKRAKKSVVLQESQTFVDESLGYTLPTRSEDTVTDLNWSNPLSDSQTQTFLRDLESTLAESASTQTSESFLSDIPPEIDILPNTNSDIMETNSYNPLTDNWDDTLTSTLSTTSTEPCFNQTIEPQSNSSLFTQTHPSTQPLPDLDLPDLLSSDGNYMHMETQTSIDDIFDQLLSNMEAQTTSESDFLHDLSFSHIETQTASDPLSYNVHTQTAVGPALCTDMDLMDMETQTGMSASDSHTQTTWGTLESLVSKLH